MLTRLTSASAVVLGLAVASAAFALSPLNTGKHPWSGVFSDAESDLAICRQRGTAAGVFGAIEVRLKPRRHSITASSSHSLGKHAAGLERCVLDALARHLPNTRGSDYSEADTIDSQVSIGTPVAVLPPVAELIPLWRNALDGGRSDRAALRDRIPPDYTLTTDNCLATKWRALHAVEELWLPGVGPRVALDWHTFLSAKVGGSFDHAVWHASGAFVVQSSQSSQRLCLVPFERTRQDSLRRELEAIGTCWVGSLTEILTNPRVAFPADRKYTSISVHGGRACAVDTSGKLTCCGKAEPPLPPAPKALASISLGEGYACGLDSADEPICWGKIPAPPPGKLVKLATGNRHACGLRPGGEVVCWGRGNAYAGFEVSRPPLGPFADVATPWAGACGLRPDGRIECWGHESLERNPPGTYRSLAASSGRPCAIRSDLTVGCWGPPGDPVEIASPERYQQVVAPGPAACARRYDDTVACWRRDRPTKPHRPPPAPTTKFTAIAGHWEQYCGIRHDGGIECWGDVWPSLRDGWRYSEMRDQFGPWPRGVQYRDTVALSGRVRDEWGWPIAGAQVLGASLDERCWSDRYPFGRRAPLSAAATTDDSGRWRSSLVYLPSASDRGLCISATAPGRELATRTVSENELPRALNLDLVLRPTSTVEVVPMCGTARCTGSLAIEVAPGKVIEGARLERVPPGTYALGVRLNPGVPGERYGRAVVDVTFTPAHLSAVVEMKPVKR